MRINCSMEDGQPPLKGGGEGEQGRGSIVNVGESHVCKLQIVSSLLPVSN